MNGPLDVDLVEWKQFNENSDYTIALLIQCTPYSGS